MSRPRVLHLIHHLRIGGAETLLAELLPRLAQADFDVQVACLDDRGPLFETLRGRGIPAHFIGRHRGIDPFALGRLRALLRHPRVDILNTHSYSAGFWGRIGALLARTPRVVTTVHTVAGWTQPFKQRLGNRLLRPCTDRIVAVSECVRRSVVAQGAPPDLVEVIPNGIPLQRFRRAADPAAERRRLGLPPAVFLAGMVARCSPEKGGDIWLRALAQLARAGLPVHGLLLGEGPASDDWKALAAAKGIADRVRFAGLQADVTPWLAVCDALVCPSRQESFGLAALEAQAAGVPVVATRVGGFLDVLHDGEDALLAPAGDFAAVAAAVTALIESPDLARRLAEAGRRNAARFAIERTAGAYAALYRALLGG